jgi:hypothetical protein
MLPHDVPPWKTVYYCVRLWQRDGTWVRLHDALRTEGRGAKGQAAEPSAAILDRQSVSTTENGGRGGMMLAKTSTGANAIYYLGFGVDRGGSCHRYLRSGRGMVGGGQRPREVVARAGHLGRWGRCRPGGGMGTARWWLDPGQQQAFHWGIALPGGAEALGGGTDVCLAGEVSPLA